jgi:hypothetical protein
MAKKVSMRRPYGASRPDYDCHISHDIYASVTANIRHMSEAERAISSF